MYILPQIFIAATCISIFRALMKKIPVQPHRDPRAILMEKGRRKVAKMVLVIVFAFFSCWSPYFMVTIVTQLQTENFLQQGQFFFTMLCINLLGFTNSCINPIIYFAMSKRFRKGFKGILTSIWQCTKKARFSPGTSSSSLRRHSQRAVLNGFGNLQRQTSGSPSPSPITPNESTGNIKVRPVSQRRENAKCQRSRTILLSFHTYATPRCQAQLIPLTDCEDDRNRSHPQFQFEDFHLAQESSIV
ncbi:unnamed protein product [Allacma fusca]|uniref:G-protein coupled receptors family 1 profile domain-containing protein n=1 Tax=Allacma fusca TaxID=39272 RepID=A0A8J2P0Z7_9HEXA|nr:unnamed protein product [Allacma fusca]